MKRLILISFAAGLLFVSCRTPTGPRPNHEVGKGQCGSGTCR